MLPVLLPRAARGCSNTNDTINQPGENQFCPRFWWDCFLTSIAISILLQFAHVGECQGPLESTTRSAQRQVQDLQAARSVEDRLPHVFQEREQKAMNNNFPFSSHDNRYGLQNIGEYFDFGMGRRKVEPQRRQQNSQNFFQWAPKSVPSSEDGLSIYQTSFLKDKSTEGPFYRRYPKHHSGKSCTDKPVPENEKNVQPNKSS
ncbi:testis-expressed protein 36 [Cyrtonyx montezumae]|uniref:testis-expressed protein 36 n=1 Tax=Cyrtonyx montezumae TaxID=9017 RepID=UPI0032DBE66A